GVKIWMRPPAASSTKTVSEYPSSAATRCHPAPSRIRWQLVTSEQYVGAAALGRRSARTTAEGPHMTDIAVAELKRDLTSAVRGRVHVTGDPTWDEARAAWNLAIDQHPRAVVDVADADDVAAAVRSARRLGLPVVAQSTGHSATENGVDEAILLRMHALDGVEIDIDRRLARVGGGAMWGAVLDRLDGTDLLGLAGTAPVISVVGYTLGGGLSWFSREHGLASGEVRSVDLVTADGERARVTAETDPELFWALREFGGECG